MQRGVDAAVYLVVGAAAGETSGGRPLDDLLSLTQRLDGVLLEFAGCWTRPAADEALLAASAPWGNARPLDWGESLIERVTEHLGVDASIGIATTTIMARLCAGWRRPGELFSGFRGTSINS